MKNDCSSVILYSRPPLEPDFMPLGAYISAHTASATMPIAVAIERENGNVAVFDTKIHATPEMFDSDLLFVEKIVKFLLWSAGGHTITIYGCEKISEKIASYYKVGGKREFDLLTMQRVYEKDFVVRNMDYTAKPITKNSPKSLGGHTNGCRIGLDAGGSDIKVSAVQDGKVVNSREMIWHPKVNSNPSYHLENLEQALKYAAKQLPRVDAIGISSAGIYINNRTALASLFLEIGEQDFDSHIRDIYKTVCAAIGESIPFEVANDGDVTALAGALELNATRVLGIAMGTSLAGGYVDSNGNITGQLNELAFVPVDINPNATVNSWSGDMGVGSDYLSQDAIIRLAARVGIVLDEKLSPADKLKIVQELASDGNNDALDIFRSVGVFLGHSVATYSHFYDIDHLLLLGRVCSGIGGDTLLTACHETLAADYPQLNINIHLPDEMNRRVGQSIAAAGLVELNVKTM